MTGNEEINDCIEERITSPFLSSFAFFKKKDTRKLVLLLITKIFCFEVDDAVEQF